MPPICICPQGVEQILSELKPHSTSGPDMIPTYLLKQLTPQLAPALSLLYQVSLDQGQLPDDWKKANIIPVFKKGNRSYPSNYIDQFHSQVYVAR